ILKLPSLAAQRAMQAAGKQGSGKIKNIDIMIQGWAVKLSKYIPIDAIYSSGTIFIPDAIYASGINMVPEEYMASAIIKSGSIALGVVPSLIILPLLAPVIVFLSILVYFKEIGKADEELKEKRDKIERELPRFVATITQELKASRDVLSILENFKKNAGEDFTDELDILTADMRSSSYEAALTRFEARINSPMLSDIT